MHVSALLVSHHGARWLPAVLEGLSAQTVPLQERVAVDTGSRDDSVALVDAAGWRVVEQPPRTSYAEAVRAGLEQIPDAGPESYIWLLHDDARPEPGALQALVEAARDNPRIAVFGSKQREWPSLKRLLELGITMSSSGRRETGLEHAEYDQGQHDQRREVLAVSTSGMLVRRGVLERLGFDEHLPLYGTDVDFGWRAAQAGERTLVVPEAVFFHAEAATRGLRRGGLAAHPGRFARAAAIRTLLVNGSARSLPWRVLRLTLGTLLRMVGFLLVRSPGEAWDDLLALGSVLAHPGRLRQARKARKEARVDASAAAPLLAPWWLPYRHGLDLVSDTAQAALDPGRSQAAQRAIGTQELLEDESDNYRTGPGLLALLARNPVFWLVLGTVLFALVGARGALGSTLAGGALLPAPGGASDWWHTYLSAHHDLGSGSAAPAPAYLLPMAVLGTLTFGNPATAVFLLFAFSVPLAAIGAVRFLRRVMPRDAELQENSGKLAASFAALAYGLLPLASGAVGEGRLGTVAGAVLLPWVATSALGLGSADADRRWRACWRTAFGGALLVAFVPAAWLLGALVALVWVVVQLVIRSDRRAAWAPTLVALLAVPVLLAPWAVGIIPHLGAWLVEAGRATALPADPSVVDLLTGRAGGPGAAPLVLGMGLPLAALLALLRADTRPLVARAWLVAVGGALLVLAQSRLDLTLPGTGTFRPWPGFGLLVVQAALVSAVGIAAVGLWRRTRRRSVGVASVVAAVGAVLAGVAVAGTTVWWVVTGLPGPVAPRGTAGVPAYMSALAANDPASGVLVLDGGRRSGVTYSLLRTGPVRLGDDAITALTSPDDSLTSTVASIVGGQTSGVAARLASYGVGYVYAPAPVSGAVSGPLDATPGFSRASAGGLHDAAWRLQPTPSLTRTDPARQPERALLLVLQGVAFLVVLVLAAPTRTKGRTQQDEEGDH